jgi:hypothetical protein
MSATASPPIPLAAAEARRLTDEVKADAQALWAKLRGLYESGAHRALGYKSWAGYCAAEFDMGKSQAYRVLEAARVVEAIPQLGNAPESVVREMLPVIREDPEAGEVVWGEVVEEHGPQPTAKQVRDHLEQRAPQTVSLIKLFTKRAEGVEDTQTPIEIVDAEVVRLI